MGGILHSVLTTKSQSLRAEEQAFTNSFYFYSYLVSADKLDLGALFHACPDTCARTYLNFNLHIAKASARDENLAVFCNLQTYRLLQFEPALCLSF